MAVNQSGCRASGVTSSDEICAVCGWLLRLNRTTSPICCFSSSQDLKATGRDGGNMDVLFYVLSLRLSELSLCRPLCGRWDKHPSLSGGILLLACYLACVVSLKEVVVIVDESGCERCIFNKWFMRPLVPLLSLQLQFPHAWVSLRHHSL